MELERMNGLGVFLPPKLPQNIYMVAVAGTGMGALAAVLADRGHKVSGSDKAAWPPIGPMLKDLGVKIKQPYGANNVADDTQFAIIGNAVSKDHEEVKRIQELEIPYASMPEVLGKYVLKDRPVWCAAGTHGKTTVTAMLGHCLDVMGQNPGYLIGGLPTGWKSPGASGDLQSPFVIEGDEYSSCFYDNSPKFKHYNATAVIMSSLEFDHADVYKSERDYERVFDEWLCDPSREVFYDASWPMARRVMKRRVKGVHVLGKRRGDAIHVFSLGTVPGRQNFEVSIKGTKIGQFTSQLFGEHNIRNWALVISLLSSHGFSYEDIASAVSNFAGIQKRQTTIAVSAHSDRAVIFDFGHHPSEIKATLQSVKARWPDRKITAIFEPRSFSSRHKVHEEGFKSAFAAADRLWLAPVFAGEKIEEKDRLDIQSVATSHGNAVVTTSYIDLLDRITACWRDEPSVLVCFSNGDFDDIPNKLGKAMGKIE